MVVWENLNAHVSRAMAELAAARPWLAVCQLPPYAPELNPVEMLLPQCELRRSSIPSLSVRPQSVSRAGGSRFRSCRSIGFRW